MRHHDFITPWMLCRSNLALQSLLIYCPHSVHEGKCDCCNNIQKIEETLYTFNKWQNEISGSLQTIRKKACRSKYYAVKYITQKKSKMIGTSPNSVVK